MDYDLVGLLKILDSLKRAPNCWCEHGIGNPMVSSHSKTCMAVQIEYSKISLVAEAQKVA